MVVATAVRRDFALSLTSTMRGMLSDVMWVKELSGRQPLRSSWPNMAGGRDSWTTQRVKKPCHGFPGC